MRDIEATLGIKANKGIDGAQRSLESNLLHGYKSG